jgi:hypothetical protein
MAGVATIGYSQLIRKVCECALGRKQDDHAERWIKTLRLSGLG